MTDRAQRTVQVGAGGAAAGAGPVYGVVVGPLPAHVLAMGRSVGVMAYGLRQVVESARCSESLRSQVSPLATLAGLT